MMGHDCEEFYRLRDQRTTEYVGTRDWGRSEVHVKVGRAAHSATGQIALLALTNQLARVHRMITFAFDDLSAQLIVPSVVPGRTVAEAIVNTVKMIDPCGDFSIRPPGPASITIGVGAGVNNCDWYIGANGAIASLQQQPSPIATSPGTVRGAALAACLGAAAVFRTQLGLSVAPRHVSAWNYLEGSAAAVGPDSHPIADVGSVLMVGAGAVGGNLAYWLHAFGSRGEGWSISDGDPVELHNTNRGMIFLPVHAGWPTGRPANKAELAAVFLPGAVPYAGWYDKLPELQHRRFDVVLALANDRDVRFQLAHRHDVIALQATTGENWISQLHRHFVGRDGCINCRTGELRTSAFRCSHGNVHTDEGKRADAALPFLSAASALMLVTAMERIATGELFAGQANCWSFDFDSPYRMCATPGQRICREDCGIQQSAAIRRRVNAGTRWAAYDRG